MRIKTEICGNNCIWASGYVTSIYLWLLNVWWILLDASRVRAATLAWDETRSVSLHVFVYLRVVVLSVSQGRYRWSCSAAMLTHLSAVGGWMWWWVRCWASTSLNHLHPQLLHPLNKSPREGASAWKRRSRVPRVLPVSLFTTKSFAGSAETMALIFYLVINERVCDVGESVTARVCRHLPVKRRCERQQVMRSKFILQLFVSKVHHGNMSMDALLQTQNEKL